MEIILGLSLTGFGLFMAGLFVGKMTERRAVNRRIQFYQGCLKNRAKVARGPVSGDNTAGAS
jgi:hypothetical protein